ncbi:MAG: hypothetical protein JWN63_3423 [Candidatus Acidoferrum typicum]|nr:hypothetical protein [Candidatus Acidoferrum typicum]
MLGMGPLLWHEANRVMHNNSKASGAEPVSRTEAWVIDDLFTQNPKWKYRSPAAWQYYRRIDEINRRCTPQHNEQR